MKPSVRPMATSMLLSFREAVRAPVPVGKGLRSAFRLKCFWAKWRGVEKCSGWGFVRFMVESWM